MTPKKLTVDDVRHHAEEVRDLAMSEVKQVAESQGTKIALIGVVALVAAVSLAYYLGTRDCVVVTRDIVGPAEY